MASFSGLKTWREISTTTNGEEQKLEVYYPHNYVQYYPRGEVPFPDNELLLPVSKLCHATHKREARQIRRHDDGYHHFIPHKKVGRSHIPDRVDSEISKSYRSYRCTLKHGQAPGETSQCYQLIPDTKRVLHGYFSWWGLAIDRQSPPDMSNITVSVGNLPGYLKNPPQSFYGKYAFVSSLRSLLESYRTSRDCQTIYLRMGGTLRYKHEIGYVVVVCTSSDREALKRYAPITSDIFDPNGLVDQDGRVVNMDSTPYFTTQYMDTSSSYETFNFALYFQDNSDDLKCPAGTIKAVEVDHECPCLHKKPIRWYYDIPSEKFKYYEKCPDKITQEDLDRHEEITRFSEDC